MKDLAFISVVFESTNTGHVLCVSKEDERKAKKIISGFKGNLEGLFEELSKAGICVQEVEHGEDLVVYEKAVRETYEEAISDLKKAFANLNNLIDSTEASEYFNEHYTETYPFEMSFDDLTFQVLAWERNQE